MQMAGATTITPANLLDTIQEDESSTNVAGSFAYHATEAATSYTPTWTLGPA
jgi:hypothetical protein